MQNGRQRRPCITKKTDLSNRINRHVIKEERKSVKSDYSSDEFSEPDFDQMLDRDRLRRETTAILKENPNKKMAETKVFSILLEGNECILFVPPEDFWVIQIHVEDEDEPQQIKIEIHKKMTFYLDNNEWMVQTAQRNLTPDRGERHDNTATQMKIYFPHEADYNDFCVYLQDLSKMKKNITVIDGEYVDYEEVGASFYESETFIRELNCDSFFMIRGDSILQNSFVMPENSSIDLSDEYTKFEI